MTDFNTYVKDLRPFGNGTPIGYNIAAALSPPMQQGEMVAWDSTALTLVRFVRDASAGRFVGVSRDSQFGIQKLGNAAALMNAVQPFSVYTTGIHELLGSAGVTYEHGSAVYMDGTFTNTVTTSAGAGGVQVGTVYLPDGTTKTGAIRVPVLIDEYTKTQA